MTEISIINENKFLKKISFEEKKFPTTNSLTKNLSKSTNKTLDYIFFVKIISAYGVIILHTNKYSFDNFTKDKKWIFFNLIEQFFIFAVPFFVLCIGATLVDFNEKYGLLEYYKRRFLKVVVPLVAWNVISYYYKIYFIKNFKNERTDIISLLNIFFQNKIYGLFYSFHVFITTYMIIPLLAYVEKSQKIKIYFYCFFILLITQSFIPYIISVFSIKLTWPYRIDAGYILYIFSGYIIQNYVFTKLTKIIIYMIGFFSFLIQVIGTHILAFKYNKVTWKHTGYLIFPTILYCNSLFLFIKEYSFILYKILNKNIIRKLGSLTIGLFFLHWPVIDFLKKYPFYIFNINIFSFYGGTLISIICFILTNILKKIPLIKYLVP